jgi:hypothetical protein
VNTVPLETPHAPPWRETWFYEQLVHGALVINAGLASYELLTVRGPVAPRDLVLLGGSLATQLVTQKLRSFATRQAALEQRAGITKPRLRCARDAKRWSAIAQVLGVFMGIATAPTMAHVPLVLWSLFIFGAWRAHRERRKELGLGHA